MIRLYKRKMFLINRAFQLSIISWFSLLCFALIGIFYFANRYFFYSLNTQAIEAGLETSHIYFTFLNEQKSLMDKIFGYTSIFSFLIIQGGGLYLSHKVAGPLYRLNQHLKNYSRNNVTPLKFRKGDYFKEIEQSFNEFIKKD